MIFSISARAALTATAILTLTHTAQANDSVIDDAFSTTNAGRTLSAGDSLTVTTSGAITSGTAPAILGTANNLSILNNGHLATTGDGISVHGAGT